jgi:hypothetical protein
MFSIAQVIRQFKQQWTRQIDERAIEAACVAAGLRWRERVLTPVFTVRLFLPQKVGQAPACRLLNHHPSKVAAIRTAGRSLPYLLPRRA